MNIQQQADAAYVEFLQRATQDERIIGVMLSGGRGKGVSTEQSDYDVILVTTTEGFEGVKNDYPKTEYIDSLPHEISEFREYAKTGTRTQYDKYTFTHNTALVDKTGEIQKLIDEKGVLEPDKVAKIVHDALGGYFNSLHRSLKNVRDGNVLAGHLDACETIPRILTFVFAIEGRVRPYNKFLAWELEKYPLEKLSIPPGEFLEKLQTIAENADVATQKEILEMVRTLALVHGYTEEVADWRGYYFG